MDLADLVRAQFLRLVRSPALHMAVIGGVAFAAVTLSGDAPGHPDRAARPELVIPRDRLATVRSTFWAENGRAPTAEEDRTLVQTLIDDEVLFRYALEIGVQETRVVQRRLAQIAAFVRLRPDGAADGGPAASDPAGLARVALALGLHRGDLVARRLLIDGARRLIRAVVLTRDPDPAALEAFFAAHRAAYRRAPETRLSHLLVDGFKYATDAEARAARLLETIAARGLTAEPSVSLEDSQVTAQGLPSLRDDQLGRRYGFAFRQALADAPVGRWFGPVPSRIGYHLVFVHERTPPSVPPLGEVLERVRYDLRQALADDWLATRLSQLRARYTIVAPGPAGGGARS